MNKEEFDKKMVKIDAECKGIKNKLYAEYALSNNPYNSGFRPLLQ